MAEATSFEQQQRIVGPDGTTLYLGDGLVANPFDATSSEASAVMVASEAARFDFTNSVVSRTEIVAAGGSPLTGTPTTMVTKVLRISAATNLALIGVARTSLPAGKTGPFAGPGSIVCVRVVAAPTAAGIGGGIFGSATPGSCDIQAVGTVAARGLTLGILVQTPLVIGGATTSTMAGVLIAPW